MYIHSYLFIYVTVPTKGTTSDKIKKGEKLIQVKNDNRSRFYFFGSTISLTPCLSVRNFSGVKNADFMPSEPFRNSTSILSGYVNGGIFTVITYSEEYEIVLKNVNIEFCVVFLATSLC